MGKQYTKVLITELFVSNNVFIFDLLSFLLPSIRINLLRKLIKQSKSRIISWKIDNFHFIRNNLILI